MATQVMTDVFFSHNAVDLSDHVKSARLTYEAEMLDETAMGATTRKMKGGLKNWELEIEFFNDEAASKVAATLFPDVGVARTVIVRPVNTGGVSATNPNYTGSAILESFPPLGGSIGEMSLTTAKYAPAGALSRSAS